jgi:hypothetical protein
MWLPRYVYACATERHLAPGLKGIPELFGRFPHIPLDLARADMMEE